MTTLTRGDRVRMKDAGSTGWLGTTIPDLGVGTVVATRDAEASAPLMEGLYVEVEWDQPTTRYARFPSIQSLEVV